jgi:hypothetical protein
MQTAEVVLGVLRERGRKGLPCEQLYRQMFNRDMYFLGAKRLRFQLPTLLYGIKTARCAPSGRARLPLRSRRPGPVRCASISPKIRYFASEGNCALAGPARAGTPPATPPGQLSHTP